MPNSSLLTVKTKATLDLYNNLAKDAWRGLAVAGAAKTISSGAITLSPSSGEGHYAVDTEASANVDQLDTINGGLDGDIVYLLQVDVARIIQLTTAGNISLPPTGYSICLSSTVPVGLRYNGSAAKWMLLSFFDPNIELWKNASGGSVSLGDVLIFYKDAAQSFTTTNLQGDPRVLGVAMETIANGAWGWIARGGQRIVNVQGNVSVGQALCTSTTVKRAIANGTYTNQLGGVGMAITAYAGGGAGTVLCELNIQFLRGGAAIVLEGSNYQSGTNSPSFSVQAGTNPNRYAVAFVCGTGLGSITSMTLGGVSLSSIVGLVQNGTLGMITWGGGGYGTGSLTFTASISASTTIIWICFCFSGVSGVGSGSSATGTSTSPAVTNTTCVPGDLLFGAFDFGAGTTTDWVSDGAGQTNYLKINMPSAGWVDVTGKTASGTTDSLSATISTSRAWVGECVPLRPA